MAESTPARVDEAIALERRLRVSGGVLGGCSEQHTEYSERSLSSSDVILMKVASRNISICCSMSARISSRGFKIATHHCTTQACSNDDHTTGKFLQEKLELL